jgi:hypothetical protein
MKRKKIWDWMKKMMRMRMNRMMKYILYKCILCKCISKCDYKVPIYLSNKKYSYSCRFLLHSCGFLSYSCPIPLDSTGFLSHSGGFQRIPPDSGHSCRNHRGIEKYCIFNPFSISFLAHFCVFGRETNKK